MKVADSARRRRVLDTVEALQRTVSLRADVLRDGASVKLEFAGLVRGDIVTLCAGDIVPADGRSIASRD